MAATRLYQTNLTGGEQAPGLRGRLDFKGYANGAELLKNLTVRAQGGAGRRAGTLFIAEASDSDQRSWLYPFKFSNEQAYVLEFSPLVIRIFRERAILTGDGDGTELVINGTFAADLASWSVVSSGTGATAWNAASGGVARLAPGAAGTTRIGQGITTTPDVEYVLGWTATRSITAVVGETDGDPSILNEFFGAGARKVKFTATATTTWIHLTSGENITIDVDDVSLQVAEPIVVASPYTSDVLPELDVRAQSADVLYIFHPDFQPHKLLRISAIEWELRAVNFYPPPTRELPQTFAATITPAAVTGANIQVDASASVFLAGDVQKLLRAGAALATIVTVDSATQIHVDIIDDFSSLTPVPAEQWSLIGSPRAALTLDEKGPAGIIITIDAAINAFRDTDLDKYVRVYGGFIRLNQIVSALQARGVCVAELVDAEDPPDPVVAGAWTLEDPIWTDDRGWPGAATFHEQRLVAGGSLSEPLTFVGSRAADFENFLLGPEDSAAYDYVVPGPYDAIQAFVSLRRLLIGSGGAWMRAQGATDAAITPGNPPIVVQESDKGIARVAGSPLVVGNSLLGVQRGARRIRDMAYSFTHDAYQATDITILVDHLMAGGVVQLAHVSGPDTYVLAVRADGALLCCAYERPEEVVGWSRWITGRSQDLTDGQFESVCTIPNNCGTGDEIWVSVKRLIDGAVFRSIEVFDGSLDVDCAERAHNNDESTVQASHLANEVAQIVADGEDWEAPLDELGGVDVNGASEVQIGLPFTSRLRTLPPELNLERGVSVGRIRRVVDTVARMQCLGPGWTVNGQPFVPVAGDEDEEVQDGVVTNLGWGRKGRVTVEQRRPFAGTILGVGGRVEVEDG